MQNKIIAVVLLASSMTAFGQAVTNPPSPQPKPDAPKPVLLKPKAIKYGGKDLPGDVFVKQDYSVIADIQSKYSVKEKVLQAKFQPEVAPIVDKIKAELAAIRKSNSWGDDVNFDPTQQKWLKGKPPVDAKSTDTRTEVTPKDITVEGRNIPGDSAIHAYYDKLLEIQTRYNKEETALQAEFTPDFSLAVKSLRADMDALRKANGWGPDVVFDPQQNGEIQDPNYKPEPSAKSAVKTTVAKTTPKK